jgi:hypothetical protein
MLPGKYPHVYHRVASGKGYPTSNSLKVLSLFFCSLLYIGATRGHFQERTTPVQAAHYISVRTEKQGKNS